jgi:predicted DNA binding CopG/RHH family protein
MKKEKHKKKEWVDYYEQANILSELTDESIEFELDDRLRSDILLKRRKRKLQNITIKMDPLHLQAIRKLATSKSIPYQTLIRHWLSEEIKKELNLINFGGRA